MAARRRYSAAPLCFRVNPIAVGVADAGPSEEAAARSLLRQHRRAADQCFGDEALVSDYSLARSPWLALDRCQRRTHLLGVPESLHALG